MKADNNKKTARTALACVLALCALIVPSALFYKDAAAVFSPTVKLSGAVYYASAVARSSTMSDAREQSVYDVRRDGAGFIIDAQELYVLSGVYHASSEAAREGIEVLTVSVRERFIPIADSADVAPLQAALSRLKSSVDSLVSLRADYQSGELTDATVAIFATGMRTELSDQINDIALCSEAVLSQRLTAALMQVLECVEGLFTNYVSLGTRVSSAGCGAVFVYNQLSSVMSV